jgi:hypothetical protein
MSHLTCTHAGCDRTFLDMALLQEHAESVHTYSDIERAVSVAVRAAYGRERTPVSPSVFTWVNDLTDDWVVFSVEGDTTTKLLKVGYSMDEAGVVTLGEAVEVQRKTVYVPVA